MATAAAGSGARPDLKIFGRGVEWQWSDGEMVDSGKRVYCWNFRGFFQGVARRNLAGLDRGLYLAMSRTSWTSVRTGGRKSWSDGGFEVGFAWRLWVSFFSDKALHGGFPVASGFNGVEKRLGVQEGYMGFGSVVLDRFETAEVYRKFTWKSSSRTCKTENQWGLLVISGFGDKFGHWAWLRYGRGNALAEVFVLGYGLAD